MKSNRTRRAVLTAGTAALAGLAGCVSGTDREGEGDPDSNDGNGTDDGTESENSSDSNGNEGNGSYSVTMEPVGTLEFDQPPERWATYFSGYADMGVALGVGDGLLSVGNAPRYHTQYYDELEGVSVEKDDLVQLIGEGGIDKEVFYELEADLHLMDPNWLVKNGAFNLEQSDVDEISTEIAPFMGNVIFRQTDPWHDYRYYSLYEAFEIVAQIFQREERYEAFASLHDEFISDVQAELPPESERPNALLVWGGEEPEAFSPYRLGEGTSKKQWRDLGIGDALEGTGVDGLSTDDRGQIDYETMLEVDPDVLLVRGHEAKSAEEFEDSVLAFMQDHPMASDLTAVQDERVFRGGPLYQGPIINLFTMERAALELFPDRFEGDLFDRERVAEIVTDGS
ncbi:ABC transporter substrate-binding protein [Natronosalvus rutilus]|uniref:ABC transporter substrate-binding protein n=1 Tax=Natronosalvus rutilus TaxID=2953753 RepID=A0A9E7NCQ6_9EURY|nr:ABC transporter substrate-binding protein [Natronosalvus rutilus]UTF54292.1 ABC transporter substrate-binding protein [Natronosalvus rutilus]